MIEDYKELIELMAISDLYQDTGEESEEGTDTSDGLNEYDVTLPPPSSQTAPLKTASSKPAEPEQRNSENKNVIVIEKKPSRQSHVNLEAKSQQLPSKLSANNDLKTSKAAFEEEEPPAVVLINEVKFDPEAAGDSELSEVNKSIDSNSIIKPGVSHPNKQPASNTTPTSFADPKVNTSSSAQGANYRYDSFSTVVSYQNERFS